MSAIIGLRGLGPRSRSLLTGIAVAAVIGVGIFANSSAQACGGISEITRDVDSTISGRILDAETVVNRAQSPPPPIPQEKKSENIQAAREVYHSLITTKTQEELVSINVMTNPCSEIDCRGINPDSALKLINSAMLHKQSQADAILKQQQAWAAIVSSSVALLSLAVSVASFFRAGRTNRRT